MGKDDDRGLDWGIQDNFLLSTNNECVKESTKTFLGYILKGDLQSEHRRLSTCDLKHKMGYWQQQFRMVAMKTNLEPGMPFFAGIS